MENPAPKRGRGRPRKYPVSEQPTRSSGGSSLKFDRRTTLIIAVLLLALAPSIYFYKQNQDTKEKLKESSQTSIDGVNELTAKIGKHALLPEGESPTITSLMATDLEKVKNQVFFAKAQAGDKVLVYNQNRLVILYRPSLDRIVNMAPLNSESNTPAQ